MKGTRAITLAAGVLFCAAAFAQGPGSGRPHGERGFGGGGFGFGPHPGKVVTGLPYSATVTEKSSRSLQDGTTIQHSRTAQVARDSQGRTYSTATLDGPLSSGGAAKTLTFISDPVAGYMYVLDSEKLTAVRRRLPGHKGPRGGGKEWNGGGENAGSDPNVARTSDTGTFNGLAVEIKTTTRTIPAGTIGNSNPIVSTSTVQIATALQVVVSAVRTDPMRGNSSYTLSNITTQEPAASLFAIPAGYAVTDAPAGHAVGMRPLPPQ